MGLSDEIIRERAEAWAAEEVALTTEDEGTRVENLGRAAAHKGRVQLALERRLSSRFPTPDYARKWYLNWEWHPSKQDTPFDGAPDPLFRAVYAGGFGIGGYDLADPADRAFAFDYDGSGRLDHLVMYRPGTGTVWVLSNRGGTFEAVYAASDGIGGYDLTDPADRAFAFDYDGSGRLDHLVMYRPGTGTVWVLSNRGGTFEAVYAASDGIGGYDFTDPADRAFAFDYDGRRRLDHLVMYRPGTGTVWVLSNRGGTFEAVYAASDGIGGYDLTDPADRAFAFDYDGRRRLDHLVMYRPGTGTVWVLSNRGGTFEAVRAGSGIGGYDLADPADRAFAFDYDGRRRLDHLVMYRPSAGTVWILEHPLTSVPSPCPTVQLLLDHT